MSIMHRLEQAGATWSERCDNLADLRAKGTLVANPTVAEGPSALMPALSLNGSSQYWTRSVSEFSNATAGTIHARIKLTALGVDTCIVSSSDTAGVDNYFRFGVGSDNKLIMATNVAAALTAVSGSTILETGIWYDVTATTSGTAWKLLLNGVAETLSVSGSNSGNWFGDVTGRDNLNIGSIVASVITWFFPGQIAELAIWDREMSTAEILSIANDTWTEYDLNLVSRWDMSNINPPDVGLNGNGNDGTGTGLVAATDLVQGLTDGDTAIEFNGTDEHIEVSGVTGMSAFTEFSVSILFRPTTWNNWDWIFRMYEAAGPTDAFYLQYDDGNKLRSRTFTPAGNSWLVPATTMIVGRWYHLVYTYDGVNTRIFHDGVQDANTGNLTGTVNAIDMIHFGKDGGAQFGPSIMSGVRVFSLALTPMQIVELNRTLRAGRA